MGVLEVDLLAEVSECRTGNSYNILFSKALELLTAPYRYVDLSHGLLLAVCDCRLARQLLSKSYDQMEPSGAEVH